MVTRCGERSERRASPSKHSSLKANLSRVMGGIARGQSLDAWCGSKFYLGVAESQVELFCREAKRRLSKDARTGERDRATYCAKRRQSDLSRFVALSLDLLHFPP